MVFLFQIQKLKIVQNTKFNYFFFKKKIEEKYKLYLFQKENTNYCRKYKLYFKKKIQIIFSFVY